MERIQLDQDIQPLSAFRSQAAAFIQHVQQTKRPLVLTQHGRSAAVVLDVGEYERLVRAFEVMEDVRIAEQQAHQDLGMSHEAAKASILKRLQS